MAKNPKVTEDPTEAALSAIEEALHLGKKGAEAKPEPADPRSSSARETRTGARQTSPSAADEVFSPAAGTADDELFADRPRSTRRLESAAQRAAAANDDRQSVGQILAALHHKSSFTPFYVATGLSVLWLIIGILVGFHRVGANIAATAGLGDIITLPNFWFFFAVVVLPAAGMFLLAATIRRSQEMRHIARAMTEVTVRLAEPEGVSTDAIVSVGQAIRREVAALGDGIERAIARATELETMVRSEVSTLERAYDENELRVRNLVEELQNERDSIVSHGTRLREAISDAHENFTLDVEGISGRINTTITDTTERVTNQIVSKSETARSNLVSAGEIVVESFEGKSNEATEKLTQVGVEVAKAISARSAKVTEALHESMESISAAIAAKGDAVREVLAARLKNSEDSIAQRGNEIADRVTAETTALGRRITDGLQGFDTTVKVYGTGLLDQITQTVNYVNENTRMNLTGFDEKVTAKMRETTESIDARIARIDQTLDARTQSLNETLANRTLEFARTITDGAKSANEAVDKSIAGMGEYFAGKAQEIAVTISDRAEAIDQTLGKRSLEISENLDGRIRHFEEAVVNRLEGITTSIETKGIAVTDALGAKVEGVTQLLRNDAALVERSLIGLAEEVSKTLVGRAEEVTNAHQAVRNDVAGMLERLGEANVLLKQVLDGVTSNLGPIEGTVTERVLAFQNALETTVKSTRGSIEHMDGQVSDLREVTTGVLRDVSTLTQRFEDQGRFIASAAESLQETHRRIDQTLTDRREAIEKFSALLTNRSSDLEERLIRFNRLLQDSLGSAEERAQEIAKLVADTTAQSSEAITQHYDQLRNSSEEERERTTLTLKAAYDQTMDEVNALFRDANQRFAEASNELREVAGEVQRSLEQTRQELKRGVLELPHETQESMAAMRRVVADQIKALTELNEVVARHAHSTDMGEPRHIVMREETMAIAGGGPRLATSRDEPVPFAELPPPRMPRAAGPRGEPAAPHRLEREPAEPRHPEREPRQGGERGGWLNELLARATQEEATSRGERPPLPAFESLDSLSVDIARMIDHDAAVELWDRYKRGERNVITRRLYTNRGQKTFEEIRKRYRKSAEFRGTVDRYIEEFERLLDQVSRDDRGQVLSKTYLTSDTGKVYTLLAHAAGRLG